MLRLWSRLQAEYNIIVVIIYYSAMSVEHNTHDTVLYISYYDFVFSLQTAS